MFAKFIQLDGTELSAEQSIINLLQRVRVLEQQKKDQSELLESILNRLHYLESN